MSVFIGEYLTNVLDELENRVSEKKMTPDEKTEIKLDIGRIPELLIDNTDRNRTSPFAFTGNRFEFRAAGSNLNPAAPVTFRITSYNVCYTKLLRNALEYGLIFLYASLYKLIYLRSKQV